MGPLLCGVVMDDLRIGFKGRCHDFERVRSVDARFEDLDGRVLQRTCFLKRVEIQGLFFAQPKQTMLICLSPLLPIGQTAG